MAKKNELLGSESLSTYIPPEDEAEVVQQQQTKPDFSNPTISEAHLPAVDNFDMEAAMNSRPNRNTQEVGRQRAKRRSQIFNETYNKRMEDEYTRTKYMPVRPISYTMHDPRSGEPVSRQEPAYIIRQHTDKDFYYVLISDLDLSERQYMTNIIRRARAEGRQLHEVLNHAMMPNANHALSYFLHRTRVTGYALEANQSNVLKAR